MKVAEALREAAARLEATSDTARLDAELLMAHVLEVSRSEMLLRHMQDEVPDGFAAMVERRARHEPVAYITGQQEFYGLDLEVSPAVLIPRADSETVIEAARQAFAARAPARILDLGTGSGALLLAALGVWPDAEGVGIDSSPPALQVVKSNAARLGHADRTRCALLDWTQPHWADDLGKFDLILANPPYVEANAPLEPSVIDFEPASALFAGPEGLDAYRVLIPQLPHLLAEDGIAVLEIGATQAQAVTQIGCEQGFTATCHKDLAGRPRALVLTLRLGK